MKRLLLAAMLAASTPAVAGDYWSQFPSLSWSDKVHAVVAMGGHYRRDCSAVMSGQPGVTSCWHITEAESNPPGFVVLVRAAISLPVRQWCIGNYHERKMVCIDQDSGMRTEFALVDGAWRSLN